MIHRIFTVYDNKAKAYLPPFFMPEVGQAVREFAYCCNNPEHAFGRHPADYSLNELGQFDDTTGIIENYNQPEHHGSGNIFLKSTGVETDALAE